MSIGNWGTLMIYNDFFKLSPARKSSACRVLNLQKTFVKCVARRGSRYGSEDIRVGILVRELLLPVCSTRVSVDTDKTVSLSFFLRY